MKTNPRRIIEKFFPIDGNAWQHIGLGSSVTSVSFAIAIVASKGNITLSSIVAVIAGVMVPFIKEIFDSYFGDMKGFKVQDQPADWLEWNLAQVVWIGLATAHIAWSFATFFIWWSFWMLLRRILWGKVT